MAIEKMTMVNIIGKFSSLDETIGTYLASGYFQPESASQYVSNVKGFSNIGEDNPYSANLARLQEMFDLSGIEPEIVSGTTPTLSHDEIAEKMDKLNERLGSIFDKRNVLGEKIKKVEKT